MATPEFYRRPAIYDMLHSQGTAREVDGLERIARDHARPPARIGRIPVRRGNDRPGEGGSGPAWLEPACGSGRYLRVAARRGVRAVGIDLDAGMLAYAGARASALGLAVHGSARPAPRPGVTLLRADMSDVGRVVPAATIDLAFNLINTIRHLASDAAMLEHLAGVARVLRPGGVYAVGIGLTVYGVEPPSEDVFVARRGGCHVRQHAEYLPPTTRLGPRARSETIINHVGVRTPRGAWEFTSAYTLRTYDTAQWLGLVARSALRWHGCVDERGLPVELGAPGYAIHLLRPRGADASGPDR